MASNSELSGVLKMDGEQDVVVQESNVADDSVHLTNESQGVLAAESKQESTVQVSQLANNPVMLTDEYQGVFQPKGKQADVVQVGIVEDDSFNPVNVQYKEHVQQSVHNSEDAVDLSIPEEPTFTPSLYYGQNWEVVDDTDDSHNSDSEGDDVDSVISGLGADKVEKVENDLELDFTGRQKIKKQRPMNKQQQESHIAKIKAQLSAFPPVPIPGFSDCFLADGGTYENAAAETSISPPKSAKKTSSTPKPNKPISLEISSTEQSNKRKTPERPRANKRNKKSKRQKTEEHEKARKVEQGMALIRTLQRQEAMTAVFTYAGDCLDKQDDSGSLIEELVHMEQCWQDANAVHFGNLMEFLKRYGIVPMGGIEA